VSTRIRVQGPQDSWIPVYCEVSPLCEHTPPRFAVAIRRPVDEPEMEQDHARAARLEQHLWRIGMEVQAAGVATAPAMDAWWADPTLGQLSPRQWEVLQRVMQGERVADIARDLFVSRSTVRNHLAAIYRLLGVHSRPELLERLRQNPALPAITREVVPTRT
jgi:DNA-binding NarL/FixJ family response regulator